MKVTRASLASLLLVSNVEAFVAPPVRSSTVCDTRLRAAELVDALQASVDAVQAVGAAGTESSLSAMAAEIFDQASTTGLSDIVAAAGLSNFVDSLPNSPLATNAAVGVTAFTVGSTLSSGTNQKQQGERSAKIDSLSQELKDAQKSLQGMEEALKNRDENNTELATKAERLESEIFRMDSEFEEGTAQIKKEIESSLDAARAKERGNVEASIRSREQARAELRIEEAKAELLSEKLVWNEQMTDKDTALILSNIEMVKVEGKAAKLERSLKDSVEEVERMQDTINGKWDFDAVKIKFQEQERFRKIEEAQQQVNDLSNELENVLAENALLKERTWKDFVPFFGSLEK